MRQKEGMHPGGGEVGEGGTLRFSSAQEEVQRGKRIAVGRTLEALRDCAPWSSAQQAW